MIFVMFFILLANPSQASLNYKWPELQLHHKDNKKPLQLGKEIRLEGSDAHIGNEYGIDRRGYRGGSGRPFQQKKWHVRSDEAVTSHVPLVSDLISRHSGKPGRSQPAFLINASRKFQNRSTVSIWIFSSGECTPSRVGPKESMSMPGYFSPMMPHSRPAWMAFTSGFLP